MDHTSFYSEDELGKLGLKKIGENVQISRKCSIYKPEHIELGNNVRIDDFCVLSGRISIGNYIHVAVYSALFGGEDGIFIGDYSSVSSRVSIYSINDDYSGQAMTNPLVPMEYRNVASEKVIIEKHVIIGSTCVVMPGVLLAEGSAFGSFSFIDHDSDEWSVNVGVPFRKIKDRKQNAKNIEMNLLRKDHA